MRNIKSFKNIILLSFDTQDTCTNKVNFHLMLEFWYHLKKIIGFGIQNLNLYEIYCMYTYFKFQTCYAVPRFVHAQSLEVVCKF